MLKENGDTHESDGTTCLDTLLDDTNKRYASMLQRISSLSAEISIYLKNSNASSEDEAITELREHIARLKEYLITNKYTSDPTPFNKHVYESVQTLKSDMRRVKGLLLSRSNFPIPSLPPTSSSCVR
jgi:hypothetical protein